MRWPGRTTSGGVHVRIERQPAASEQQQTRGERHPGDDGRRRRGRPVQAEIAGTPTFVYGEGYSTMVSMRRDGGPWELMELQGTKVEPGMVHRVQARIVRRDPLIADASSHYVEVIREVGRERGGPPVKVVPGRSVAGIDVTSDGVRDATTEAAWGPFTVGAGEVAFSPFAVGGIEVGGRALPPDASLDDYAAAFPSCVREPVRGNLVVRCAGVTITSAGPTASPEAIRIRVETAK